LDSGLDDPGFPGTGGRRVAGLTRQPSSRSSASWGVGGARCCGQRRPGGLFEVDPGRTGAGAPRSTCPFRRGRVALRGRGRVTSLGVSGADPRPTERLAYPVRTTGVCRNPLSDSCLHSLGLAPEAGAALVGTVSYRAGAGRPLGSGIPVARDFQRRPLLVAIPGLSQEPTFSRQRGLLARRLLDNARVAPRWGSEIRP
jgi:hypothetical protein